MKTLASILMVLAFSSAVTAANAGSNTCEGKVQSGAEWTMVKGDSRDQSCRFKTDSKVGREILASCPDGSDCLINIPLSKPSRTLTVIERADRLVTCPDGSKCIPLGKDSQ